MSYHVRNYLIRLQDDKCEKCSWSEINPSTGNVLLTINHIDGNSNNHHIKNLEVLCPNCHSLTPNYGNLNKGNGRASRYERV